MMRVFFILFLPLILSAKIGVVVSILPQKFFVEKVAGDLVDVTVMVAPGSSPATYEPKPSQMRHLAQASIYFSVGVPFERSWLPRFSAQNPAMQIVDSTQGILKMAMVFHHHDHHEHHTQNLDPHVWLSPPLVAKMVENIAKTLGRADKQHAALYRQRAQAFQAQIMQLHRQLKKILKPCHNKAMMVFHPSWGYFAKAYSLRQIPIEIEGKEPRSKELVHLIHEAKEEGVEALFVQPQFSKRSAQAIAEAIGAKVIEADPLAYEWDRNLLTLAHKICEATRSDQKDKSAKVEVVR